MSDRRQSVDPHPDGLPALRLRSLTGRYGNTTAVDGLDLDVSSGEFVTLLGPSGSGKTTTLRLIAGFLQPTAGTIELAGRDVTGVPPYRRDIGMVFQNYALFPHMTAGANVSFPLEMRRVPRREALDRVHAAFSLVRLHGLEDRYPRQLSGGQQQRVALARALVFEPRLLLMDEPLGALDKKLRDQLQLELKRIHDELGITVVYVTHDQEEALVLSDRIAIFNEGKIAQLGSARDIYQRPASLFVADFIGEANVLPGSVASHDDELWLATEWGTFRVGSKDERPVGTTALIIRPERLQLVGRDEPLPADSSNEIEGTIAAVIYLGAVVKYSIAIRGAMLTSRLDAAGDVGRWKQGDAVKLRWHVADGVLVHDIAPQSS